MESSLQIADRKLRLLRLLHGVCLVLAGMLAVFNLMLTLSILALAAAAQTSIPQNVLPVAKALFSTLAAVAIYYRVISPLYRQLPLPAFVRLLEKRIGRETYLLSASHFSRSVATQHRDSPYLLENVGTTALRELAPLGPATLPAVRTLSLQAVVFALLLSLSLVVNMTRPEVVRTALVRLLQRPEATATGSKEPEHVASVQPRVENPKAPPCRDVKVFLHPPEYLKADRFAAVWDHPVQVLQGSSVDVLCVPAGQGRGPVLEIQDHNGARRVPFSETRQGEEAGHPMQARVLVTGDSRITIGDLRGAWQPGELKVSTVPDKKPACTLTQPRQDLELLATGTVSLLVEATDDTGLATVVARYLVEGLDTAPGTIELARPSGQRRAVIQRELPVSSFGAEPEDRIELYVEAQDANNFNGPSVCTTASHHLTVRSPLTEQKERVHSLARLRDQAIDLVAVMLVSDSSPQGDFRQGLDAYAEALDMAASRMGETNLFKVEDTRRIATLAASLEDLQEVVAEGQPSSTGPPDDELVKELEQHILVLDGVVEKLLGEYLFQVSGRIQHEVERLVTQTRDASVTDETGRTLRRSIRRLQRISERAITFKAALTPQLPALFTRTGQGESGDWLMRIAHFGQTVAEDGTLDSAAAWRERLDELAQMVEQAAQSIESAYAQSMTRLSSSFRKAQTELTRRLDQARLLNLSVRQELEVLIKEVEKETQNYIKHRKTIEGARSVARRTRKLMKKARSFRASTYLKVERGQVLEFRERLSRLSAAVGVLKLDDAIGVAEELVALTNSMEFSLKLSIRYSQDERLVKQSRKELSKVRDARKLAEQIQARLSVLRPQRSRLRSLRSENLEALNTSLDELHKQVLQIRGEVDGLTKRFPIFFSKFGPALEQISEALRQTREKLGELMLEESFRLSVYMDDNLIRLVETLTNATRNARTAHALAAGGAQPSLDIAGKEEHMSVEQLESYLQLGANLGKRKEWQVVIDKYFSLLSP